MEYTGSLREFFTHLFKKCMTNSSDQLGCEPARDCYTLVVYGHTTQTVETLTLAVTHCSSWTQHSWHISCYTLVVHEHTTESVDPLGSHTLVVHEHITQTVDILAVTDFLPCLLGWGSQSSSHQGLE